ncbi:MAG TPA: amino acid adenylation domain-containing protein [Ktedonobacterales bacterium]|jgi:amino acid adenylation domain-containing protein
MSDLSKRIADLSPEKREILLKRLIEQQKVTTTPTAIPRRSQVMSNPPLSFAQEPLWFIDQLTPGSAAYNLPYALRLSGPLDLAALEQSLQEIVKRHESLRTTFPAIEGRPVQMIASSLQLPFSVVDLRDLEDRARWPRAIQSINEEITRPFDLAQGPLLRTMLFRLTEQEHILLLLMHHIISDGWSVGILVRELTTLYSAFTAGQPSPLPELPIQYADYALWRREWLQGERMEDQLTYWKQQLADAPAVLDLPTDHPRPAIQTFRGAVHNFRLSRALTEQIQTLSQQEGATIFMTLLAAFNVLLSRYTGQEDIVVGSPIANRNRSEVQELIGYLVTMLVLRTDLSGDPGFRELLKRVRKMALEAYAHHELPFEKLVEALHPERSLSHSPLFQVVIADQNAAPTAVEAAGLSLSSLDVEISMSKFDLTLYIWEEAGSLVGSLEYNIDLFEAATIERMAGHFQTLLQDIAANPDQPLSRLPLLTEAERSQLLVAWNATQAAYPENECVHQLFEAQAQRTPEGVALVYEKEQLTYQALNQRANQLAHYLQKLGVGPDVRVGLYMERSLEMVVGLLGILKAGGTYIPLDPAFPQERLAFMLEDAQVMALVTQQRLTTQLPAGAAKIVRLDADAALLKQQSSLNPVSQANPENLAYVIYTSGSTGKPKGVQIPHRAVVNFLLSMRQQPGLTANDRLLAITTLSFDIAGLELFLPLIVGARVIIASRETTVNGAALAELMARSGATVMQATPVTWRLLLAAGWQGSPYLKILCGGEAFPPELAAQLLPRAGSVWNMYGPTETTIWSTLSLVQSADDLSIGRPIANTEIYVLDAHLNPTPIGVPGELYIGGDGLARGYLNRPELTAERFIPHPFSARPDARLYRTGDLARYRADGQIDHLGRVDFQVKIRGFRIELGEIETTLVQHPAVRQAVVLAREDTPGDKRLVAYVVAHQQQEIKANELRSFLREYLPDYMIPAAFTTLDAFPETPNGKIDRRALPAPELDSAAEEHYVPPMSMVHYQLIHLWEELLEARPIGIRDNFFFLGGHSLLAARLVNGIEQVFGKKIPLATFFAGPTIEQLAEILSQDITIAEAPVVAVQSGGSRRPIFYMHEDRIGGAYYCFPLADHLGPEQPFYTVEPYKFDTRQAPPTFEAMAATHVRSIQAIQPEGPYLLGGFCIGGLLAYEIARQLQGQGQQVDLLVLIDPTPPAPASDKLTRRAISLPGKALRIGEYRQFYSFLWVRHLYKYLRFAPYRREMNKAGRRRGKGSAAFPSLRAIFPTLATLCRDRWSMTAWMLAAYTPGAYPGKITFFWAKEEVADSSEWRGLADAAQETELHVIPGDHLSCLTKHLSSLAEEFSACLAKVQEAELERV